MLGKQVDNILAALLPQSSGFGVKLLRQDVGQSVQRPVIVQQLPNECSGAPEALRLFLQHRRLLRCETERLREVVGSGRSLWHGQLILDNLELTSIPR